MSSLGLAKDARGATLSGGDTPLRNSLLKNCTAKYTPQPTEKADADCQNRAFRHRNLTSCIRFSGIVDWIRTGAAKCDRSYPSYGASDLSVKEMANSGNQFERMLSMVPI